MARKPRIEFEGAFYHVIVRGNQRQKIFKASNDYLKYLYTLSDYKKRYKFLLYAYVLMKNHVHLLIETKEVPLSKILQGINQRYTMYFNRKYKTVGHLFQGRYKAILCDKDEYLLSLVKYIHFNPLRGGVVKMIDSYRWTSHHSYVKKNIPRDNLDIVDTDKVLRLFSEVKSSALRLYIDFMGGGTVIPREDMFNIVDQRVLGGEQFIEKIMNQFHGRFGEVKRSKEFTLDAIAKAVESVTGVSLREIRQKDKDKNLLLGKKIFCLSANKYGYRGKEIADFIRKDAALVTRYLKDINQLKTKTYEVIKILGSEETVNSQV
jgi:REP element-mobilizing transposase RayT